MGVLHQLLNDEELQAIDPQLLANIEQGVSAGALAAAAITQQNLKLGAFPEAVRTQAASLTKALEDSAKAEATKFKQTVSKKR